MRKHCIKYSQSHPNHEAVRQDLARVRERAEFDAALERHYGSDGPGRYVPDDYHRKEAE